jgi:hypothetical protein
MQSTAIKKMELMHNITKLPDEKINEVEKFVKRILAQLEVAPSKPISLKGIWKNKGFEKILDLESELKLVRRELSNSILKKEI